MDGSLAMITLLQLKYFQKLAATEHITQTAKDLFISQTALSSMIIGLEKELGVQLFDRSKRSIHLNEAGRIYLKYVDEIFMALDNANSALRDMTDSRETLVSLAVSSSLVWAPLFHSFHKAFPNYSLKQFNYAIDGLTKAMHDNELDFVIAGEGDISAEGLERALIKYDRIYLCVSQNNKFAKREEVFLSELKDEPFISLPIDAPWRKYCDELFQKAGYSVSPVVECDYTMRAPLIESEFGIALTSSSAREVDLLKPNVYIPIADDFATRKMELYWNPKRYMSQAAHDFMEFCKTYWPDQQD